jgi:hypothetical protein
MPDTLQARLVQLGLLERNASGVGWDLTQEGRDLLSGTLTHPHKSQLAADLLDLGMIEPAPSGSGLWWVFTAQGRKLMAYLLNNPVSIEKPDPGTDDEAI